MKTCKRTMALLLVLVMTLCVVVPAYAAPAVPAKNTGVRHEICTDLSTQAEAYYTDAYTWDALSALNGLPTDSSLEAMEGELYQALHTLMADTQTASATYRTLHDYWTYTDTQPGYTNATLFYGDVDGGLHDYDNHSAVNREHVWPKSHGSFVEDNAGCDLHHLRPANAGLNSTRNNYVMANVRELFPTPSTKDFDGKTVLWYDYDSRMVEVADNVKGDVARILLYVYTRWGQPNLCVDVPADKLPANDNGSSNDGIRVMDDLDTLLSWCAMDPVDAWEMGRNDRVQDVQGNRNVFIDYPELAWLMFGQDVPAGMDTPSGNAANSGTTYTVTAATNNDAWGTVEAQGTRVVCTPAEGYFVDHVELNPADAAEVVLNGDIVKLNNITADVEVTVYFAAKTAASISYLLPEGAVAEDAAVNGYVGDPIVLPAVTGDITVDGVDYRFEGWVRSTVADTTDLGETVVLEAGDTYVVESTKEVFIGLYSYTVAAPDGEGEATTFNKVTVAPADWSGEYVMAGTKNDGSLTLLLADGTNVGANTGSVALDAANVSQDGDTLNGVTANYVVVIAKQDDGTYTMQLKGAAEPTYLAFYGTSNKLYTKNDPADPASRWDIQLLEDGSIDIISKNPENNPARYLRYNVSSNMFRCYKSGQAYVSLYAAGAPTITHYLTLAEAEQPFVNPFVDVTEQDYFYESVLWAAENGITTGVDATHFAPAETCNRGQIAMFLWNVAGQPAPTLAENPFPDVEESDYFYNAVLWAYENKIITGRAEGFFDPYAKCTRGEIVTLLWRMYEQPAPETAVNPFPDVAETAFYHDAVLWAAENEIVLGNEDGTFAPDATSTRAHVVCFLARSFRG